MKKAAALPIVAIWGIILIFSACANNNGKLESLTKEGIAPCQLSNREILLLQSFNMEKTSHIIEFNAPAEAISLSVNIYQLNTGNWDIIDGGAISIGDEREPINSLKGTFAMKINDDYTIDYIINCAGLASYKTKGLTVETEIASSANLFLQDFQEIEVNKEIPVALMVYDNGTSMRSFSLQDYFEPSVFEGMDVVRAITLTFSDELLESH